MRSEASVARASRLAQAVLAALAALASACSSASAPDAAGTPSSSGATPTATETTGGTGECASVKKACTPGAADAAGRPCVTTIDTSVVDVDGRALADVPVMTCSDTLCVGGKSDASGQVHLRVCHPMASAAVKIEGVSRWVSTATPLPAPGTDGAVRVGPQVAVLLPASGEAFPDTGRSGRVESGGVELALASDHGLRYPPLVQAADERAFRAAAMPEAWSRDAGVDLAFGLAPVEARFAKPTSVSLPNASGWAPGAEVELLVMGFDPSATYEPYAAWKSVGSARVTSDGGRIASDDGVGIEVLTIVGARLRR